MRTIKARPLSAEAFASFGTFVCLTDPVSAKTGYTSEHFFPDLCLLDSETERKMTVSVGVETYTDRYIIAFAECHRECEEGLLALDGDYLLYVAAADGDAEPAPLQFCAFYVPQGCFVVMKKGVWHGCQIPVRPGKLHTMILLPEKTCLEDTRMVPFSEDNRMEIVL